MGMGEAGHMEEYPKVSKNPTALCVLRHFKHVQLFETSWTLAHQAPLLMEISRQAYWSGLPFPSPGDLPDTGIEPAPPRLAGGFFTTEPPGKFYMSITSA